MSSSLLKKLKLGVDEENKEKFFFFFFHLLLVRGSNSTTMGYKKNYDSTTSSTRKIFITRARRKDQIKNEVKSTDRDSKQYDLTL
jgi:hypothetical protein